MHKEQTCQRVRAQILSEITTSKIQTNNFRECQPSPSMNPLDAHQKKEENDSVSLHSSLGSDTLCAELTPSGPTSSKKFAKLHTQRRATSHVRVVSTALRHQICFVRRRADARQISVFFSPLCLAQTCISARCASSVTDNVWMPMPSPLDCRHGSQERDTAADFAHEVFRHHPFANFFRQCVQFCDGGRAQAIPPVSFVTMPPSLHISTVQLHRSCCCKLWS